MRKRKPEFIAVTLARGKKYSVTSFIMKAAT